MLCVHGYPEPSCLSAARTDPIPVCSCTTSSSEIIVQRTPLRRTMIRSAFTRSAVVGPAYNAINPWPPRRIFHKSAIGAVPCIATRAGTATTSLRLYARRNGATLPAAALAIGVTGFPFMNRGR